MKKTISTIFILLFLISCKKEITKPPVVAVQEIKPVITIKPPANFSKGADASWLTQMEASGRKFYDASGKEMEGMALLKTLGMNTIRLRVWVNPSPAYNNTADLLVKALRAKKLGLRIMIDFHYSDNWADPGKQTKPAAWDGQDMVGLRASIEKHTVEVLTELKKNEINPEWVQVGNETNNGMLWPDGRASTNMANFASMINAGYEGVKAIYPNAKVIVHISNGYDNSLFRWMFDGLKSNGAKFDVIGMSLYPSYSPSGWAAVNQQCLANMNDMVARYNKEVMIVEVGMPWDKESDCKAFLSDLLSKSYTVTNNKAIGVLYWEPQSYNNWQGYSLGAFDNSGKPTIAMSAFAD